MKSSKEWAGQMCINSEIVKCIQRDALLEALVIAQRIATESSQSYEIYHGAMLVHDAILERAVLR